MNLMPFSAEKLNRIIELCYAKRGDDVNYCTDGVAALWLEEKIRSEGLNILKKIVTTSIGDYHLIILVSADNVTTLGTGIRSTQCEALAAAVVEMIEREP